MSDSPSSDPIVVPDHGWTLHVAPSGHLYAFNHLRQFTSWKLPHVQPDPPLVPFPPPLPQYVVSIPAKETPIQKMRLGETHFYVIWTDAGNRYFYNTLSKRSTWRLTPDLYPLLEAAEKMRLNNETNQSAVDTPLPSFNKGEDGKEDEHINQKEDQAQLLANAKVPLNIAPVMKEDENREWELRMLEEQYMEEEVEKDELLSGKPPQGLVSGYGSDDEEEGEEEEEAHSFELTKNPVQNTDDDDDDDDDEIGVPTLESSVLRFYEHLSTIEHLETARWETLEERWPDWVSVMFPDEKERKRLFDLYFEQLSSIQKESQEEDNKEENEEVSGQEDHANPRDPLEVYRQLVLQHRHYFWEDFKKKFLRDPRFLNAGMGHKEREKLFQTYRKEAKTGSITATHTKENIKVAMKKKERHLAALKARAREVQRERIELSRRLKK